MGAPASGGAGAAARWGQVPARAPTPTWSHGTPATTALGPSVSISYRIPLPPATSSRRQTGGTHAAEFGMSLSLFFTPLFLAAVSKG